MGGLLILALADRPGPATVRELAGMLGHDNPSATHNLVRAAQAAGLVTGERLTGRRHHPVGWTLTEDGRRYATNLPLPERPRRTDAAERAELAPRLVARYLAGRSIWTVAADHGLAYGTVRRALIEAGCQLRRRGGSQPRFTAAEYIAVAASVVAAYQAGTTIDATAKEHGIGYGTARQMLVDSGCPLRSRGAPRSRPVSP
nr:helix-turn-helix domain-containing protein [Micromonospora sp. DSM 115978]